MQLTTIGDIAIHFSHRRAAANRPTLAFINSLGTDLRIWDDVLAELAGEFSTLVYDKRGHGLSDAGARGSTIAAHAQDLIGLLDHIEARKVILCGLSIGGLIAQQVAAARPERLEGLILCDTAHKIGTPDLWNQRIATVEREGIAAIADGILERWFTPGFRAAAPALYAGCRNMLIRQPVVGYTAACAAVRDADQAELVGRIATPTLVVVGDKDGSTPPDLVRSMAALMPGARFKVIPDAGHIPCVEQPRALVALLRDFLTSNGLLP